MSNGRPRVLIIEPYRDLWTLWSRVTADYAEVECLSTLQEEVGSLLVTSDFRLVVVGCAGGNIRGSVSMVALVRRMFAGPILANSSFAEDAARLIETGATHWCFKSVVPGQIYSILNP